MRIKKFKENLFRLRDLLQEGHQKGHRVPAVKCHETACFKTTTEGKPFCVDHTHLMPYVVGLLDKSSILDQELQEALQGNFDCNSFLSEECLTYLYTIALMDNKVYDTTLCRFINSISKYEGPDRTLLSKTCIDSLADNGFLRRLNPPRARRPVYLLTDKAFDLIGMNL